MMKIDKKKYFTLTSLRKARRILRRSCKAAGGWITPNDGIRTKIILHDSFGQNILKSRRYKARHMKWSFAEYYKNNECVTLNKKGGEYETKVIR